MISSRFFAFIIAMLVSFQVSVWAKEVILTEADNGGKYTLDVGDTLKVVLDGNPTTGFAWGIVSPEKRLKKIDTVYAPTSPACGAGGTYTFVFKAEDHGKEALILNYRRPWEKEVEPAKTFEVDLAIKK